MKKLSILLCIANTVLNAMDDSPRFIYVHGFGSNATKKNHYVKCAVIPEHTLAFDFQDAWLQVNIFGREMGLNLWNSCIGQDDDMQRLSDIIDACPQDVVLFGESRGASTIINYLGSALAQPEKVKAVILDSPFDTLIHVLSHRMKRYFADKFIDPKTVEKLLPFLCWKYKLDGIQPIHAIKNISREIPILLICSREDTQVPWKSSHLLYKELRKKGHEKVFVYSVAYGSHGRIMQGKAKKFYRKVVHAFYKKHDIWHHPEYAQEGENILISYCQPALEDVDQELQR